MKYLMVLVSLFLCGPFAAQTQQKLLVGQLAPDFAAVDSNNDTIRLSHYRGKRVYLTLYRNVGCAVCNLRFHEIESLKDSFQKANAVVIGVYESSLAKLQEYTEGGVYFSKLIANPDLSIYSTYGDELSGSRAFKSLFHGVLSKGKKGSKLFKKKIKQDGNQSRIGAEFIIDEKGTLVVVNYHRFVGDHLPSEEIIRALQ